jgi:hypothetical protein
MKATRHVIENFGSDKVEEIEHEAICEIQELDMMEDETREDYEFRQNAHEIKKDNIKAKAFDTIFQTLEIKESFVHGDIADFGDGYRNKGCFIFDGVSLLPLDYSRNEYGSLPLSFMCFEPPFFRNPDYWIDVISHNYFIHINTLGFKFHSFTTIYGDPVFSLSLLNPRKYIGIVIYSQDDTITENQALKYLESSGTSGILTCSSPSLAEKAKRDDSYFSEDESLDFDFLLTLEINDEEYTSYFDEENRVDVSLIMNEKGWV